MKHFCALVVFVVTTLAFAQQDQKLPNGHWAFYGEEFYTALSSGKKIERALFHKIFNEQHQFQKGKYDTVSNSCTSNCYRHTQVGYEKARLIMFGELDTLRDNNGTYVLDVYCGKKFYFSSLSEVSHMHDRVNIEHTWPQSKFTGSFPKEQQKCDMHHLYLTDSKANSVRGNTPFGLVDLSADRSDASGCNKSQFGIVDGQETYTPPAPHRGNVARALFYFSMHYNLGISSSEERILRQWDKDDPIDANEIKRHEGVAKHQKNRNPFVDYPALADKVSDF